MKKIAKETADAYFKERVRSIVIYLIIWALVSYFVIAFAESFSKFTVNGFPFHYFMGDQGSVITFIILLFVNAVVNDKIDKKYGIDEKHNERLSQGKVMDH